MNTVLVVDDLPPFVDLHVDGLQGSGLQVATATSLEELTAAYEQHRDELIGIILDGCVPGDKLNTLPFIERVSADRHEGLFRGFLIAASSDSSFRRTMVRYGCTHEAPKGDAAPLLRRLLGK